MYIKHLHDCERHIAYMLQKLFRFLQINFHNFYTLRLSRILASRTVRITKNYIIKGITQSSEFSRRAELLGVKENEMFVLACVKLIRREAYIDESIKLGWINRMAATQASPREGWKLERHVKFMYLHACMLGMKSRLASWSLPSQDMPFRSS